MSSRASVSSQVAPQPLILAASSMSRHSSDRSSKRDSGIGIGNIVNRIGSLSKARHGRPASDTETMAPAPVYRLYPGQQYPHQSSDGRRELRALNQKDRPQSSTSERAKLNSRRSSTTHHAPGDTSAEDFEKRYSSRWQNSQSDGHINRSGKGLSQDSDIPDVPDLGDVDDGPGQAVTSGDAVKRGIEIPARTSSSHGTGRRPASLLPSEPMPSFRASGGPHANMPATPDTVTADCYEAGARSSAGSVFSEDTETTSIHTLPPLQTKGPDGGDAQYLEPVMEDDPASWDLVAPYQEGELGVYALEKRADQLFSRAHLQAIFDDPKLLLKFTGFLNSHRPKSISLLIYYLDALKALRAINYANAIAEALEPIGGQDFTQQVSTPTNNSILQEKANRAFAALVQDDLPAFIAHTWVQVVSMSIQRRITGTLAPHLREASEGLAEVFCMTDPSRVDNPIVFASEEFTRTTQYGMSYAIGRNCRFLQGPKTNPNSPRRLATACAEGRELTEVMINYRRDGSPFLNLLMIAPLMDSRGNIRYFIGAQVDVSGLLKDCVEMDALLRLVERDADPEAAAEEDEATRKDEFQELSEMFNGAELDTVRKCGGRMHKEYVDDSDRESMHQGRPRLLLKDPSGEVLENERTAIAANVPPSVRDRLNGKLEGIYQHYLLIRPAPSLRILFTSPSLRVPGILQSPFLNRIGGSSRVRADLRAALAEGRGVTAKIRWLTRPDEDGEGEGRPRWIHCTPLLGHSGAVGVWMIVLVDDDVLGNGAANGRRFRQAPPVSSNIGGKEWDAAAVRARRTLHPHDSVPGTPATASHSRDARPSAGSHKNSTSASEFSFNLKS